MVQGVSIEKGYIVNLNPATGEAIQPKVKVSTNAEVDAAVAAAGKAQAAWTQRSLAERTELVKKAVKEIGVDKAGLARQITIEMGKTLAESEEEVDDNADKDEYCELVRQANEPEIHGGSVIHRHAHGVVSICAPWNYPIEEIVLLAIPSLIAGNAIVVKPSEVVPLSSGAVVRCLQKSLNAAQPGLVGLVQGDGTVGSYLVAHPGVHMCAFTGSTATGAKILQAASASLKPVVLECGGKDPMVVFADADLDQAAKDAVDFSVANCGQVCCAVERVYVAQSVAADFEKKVVARAQLRGGRWARAVERRAQDRADGLRDAAADRPPPRAGRAQGGCARCARGRDAAEQGGGHLLPADRARGRAAEVGGDAGGDLRAGRRALHLRRHRRAGGGLRQRLELRPHRVGLLGRPHQGGARRQPAGRRAGEHQQQLPLRRARHPLPLRRPQEVGLRLALGQGRLASVLGARAAAQRVHGAVQHTAHPWHRP